MTALAAADGIQPAQGVRVAVRRGDTAAERALIARQTSSILDLIDGRTRARRNQVGASDQRVMDSYLTTIREIERGVWRRRKTTRTFRLIEPPTAPAGQLETFVKQVCRHGCSI